MKKKLKKMPRALIFPGLFIFIEIMFHLYYFQSVDSGLVYASLFAASFGFVATAVTSFPVKKANLILAWIITSVTTVFFGLQLVYGHIFKTFISFHSVLENAGDASEFWKEALNGILESLPGLILCMGTAYLSVALALKMEKIGVWGKNLKQNTIYQICCLAVGLIIYIIAVVSLAMGGKEPNSDYDLYNNDFMLDRGIERFGVIAATRKDFHELLFGDMKELEIIDTGNLSSLSVLKPEPKDDSSAEAEGDSMMPPTQVPSPVPAQEQEGKSGEDEKAENATPTPSPSPTPTPLPTPTPIDTSPNVLDIDFSALAENCDNSDIRTIHEYMALEEPSKKNEYTGMFKDYNLIYLCCEGFSTWAIDENVTPTLYKLTHEGFVFNNFYNPIWYTSTSDGEYVECTGLIPYSTNSFKRSKKNSLPFCFGWQFLKEGYTSRAYHDHTATYYGREDTHPNLGYIFKARGRGLDVKATWPESDLEMMEKTIPEYINDDHFHVYYMTVSGHLEYNFEGNYMASKNKDAVADLPYSSHCRAYIACNKELDLALEYLISELDKAGKLENTVIAFSGDHYPYGLTNDEISEIAGHTVETEFELYKSSFVLWSASMQEPVEVDKYCSTLDMLPTLSNLFGLEYDSRLLMGNDILSDSPALVVFSDRSFITDYCMYNVNNGAVTMLQDVELPEGYISAVSNIVKNKFNISKSILLNDYYSYIIEYIPDVVTKVPDSY